MEQQIQKTGSKAPDAGKNGGASASAGAAGGEDFATLFEQSIGAREISEGDIVKGKIIALGNDFAIVDIGYKSEGQIPIEEFREPDGALSVKVGDEIDVLVEVREDDSGLCILSKEKADRLKIWDDISKACEQDQVVEGVIVARVKGGLSVDIGVKAFLPGSQVDLRPIRNLDKLIGQRHQFKVIKFNKKRGNIVLSRRVLLEKERDEQKKRTLDDLQEGSIRTGVIKNITEYGAFVDMGGIDGLLHITDMSWGRVNHPSEVFNVGDEVQVKVLKFDPEKERVSLGLKQITDDPWNHAEEKFPIGARVEGKVVSITDYGAFVELEQGVEGLVHVSEMTWTKRVKHPSKLVNVGDRVEAIVREIDVANKRISLSMKHLMANPWNQLAEKYPLGSTIRGRIRNITDFGVFVGIEEGIDGLVHISDISWTHRVRHPSELFKKGDEVEAVVMSIDPANERFSLSIKALYPDPWDRIPRDYPVGKIVEVKVMKVLDFGAFVELEPGIEGLIHVSELREERVKDPREVVKKSDVVMAEIIAVDPGERKISLSAKAVGSPDERSAHAEHVQKAKADEVVVETAVGAALKSALKKKGKKGKKGAEADEASDGAGSGEGEGE
ncbi:MAG TPA: 30S ribosomal protein S1 [Myxococcota bacterium]|jgi:small subunit ribosomal protein S1|nr:30S ribosomal protein S1 [Myxococcota bacterium]